MNNKSVVYTPHPKHFETLNDVRRRIYSLQSWLMVWIVAALCGWAAFFATALISR